MDRKGTLLPPLLHPVKSIDRSANKTALTAYHPMAKPRNRHSPLRLQLAPHPNQHRILPLRRVFTPGHARRAHCSGGLAHTGRGHHPTSHRAGFHDHHRRMGTQYLWVHWNRRWRHSIRDVLFWSVDEDEEPVCGFQRCRKGGDEGEYGDA